MASRSIHNKFVRDLIKYSSREVDEVNRMIDEPVKTLGPAHRILYHDPNPFRIDSLLINRGNMNRELVRQLHIYLDRNKKLEEMIELSELLKKLRKR